MCRYCAYSYHDGWTALLQYDDTYQEAMSDRRTTEATHGFHDSWDDLRAELDL